MATETGAPDDFTDAPPSQLGEALERVGGKAEEVEVAEHDKIGHTPDEEMKEGNMFLAENLSKLHDPPEDKQIAAEAKPGEAPEKAQEITDLSGSYEEVEKMIEEIKPKETLEALMRKDNVNQGEIIQEMTSESCDKDVTHSSNDKDHVINGSIQHKEEAVEVPTEVKASNGRDERKTEELATSEETKMVTKQLNNIIAKVKHSLVKAKKAIIAKSPSFKVISTDARGCDQF